MKAANAQGWDDVTFLFLTSVYSENFAAAIDDAAAGIYVPAEFYPFTEENEINADWRRDDRQRHRADLVHPGGFLAATYFIEVWRASTENHPGIRERGPEGHEPIDNPMVGTPFQFGTINTAGWPIAFKTGTNAWEKVADDWLRDPQN